MAPPGLGVTAMIAYELWETESGNLMASFPTKAEALAVVADRVSKHGPSSVESITLLAVDDSDQEHEFVTLAEGPELVKLIENAQVAKRTVYSTPTDRDDRPPSLADVERELDEVQSRLSSELRAEQPDLFDVSGRPRKGALGRTVQQRTGKTKLSRADILDLLRKRSS
jgi:hypothetical protein